MNSKIIFSKLFFFFFLSLVATISYPTYSQNTYVSAHPIQAIYGIGGYPYAFHEEFLPIYGGAGVVFKSNFGFELIYTSQYFEANNLPNDYEGGLCLFKPCVPRILNSWSLPITKSFTSPNDLCRLKFGIGPALFMYQEPNYTKATPSGGIFNFSSNYDINYKKKNLPGLYGQFRAEFLPALFLGLGLGLSVKINSEITYLSFDTSIMLGYLRPSLKKLQANEK